MNKDLIGVLVIVLLLAGCTGSVELPEPGDTGDKPLFAANQPGVEASDTDAGTDIRVSSTVYDLNPTSNYDGRPRVYLGVRSPDGELVAERLKPVDGEVTLPGEGGARVESTLSLQDDEYASYCGEEVEFTAAVNPDVSDLPAESGLSDSVSSTHIEESSSIESGDLYTSYADTVRLVCNDGGGSDPSGDYDDDGVRNSLDGCPEQAGPPRVGGCPENACYMHHDFWETYNMYPGTSYTIDPKDGNPIGETASITFVEERSTGYVFDVQVQDDERREVVNVGGSFSITDAGKQDTKSVGVQLLNVTNVQGDPNAELEATACLANGDDGDRDDGDGQCSPSGCEWVDESCGGSVNVNGKMLTCDENEVLQYYSCDAGVVSDVYRCYETPACQNSSTTESDPYSLLVDTRLSEDGDDDTFRIGTAAGRPGSSFNYNYTVRTNGTVQSPTSLKGLEGDVTLEFESPGVYQVNITGEFPAQSYPRNNGPRGIVDVLHWGNNSWEDMSYMFHYAENLDRISAEDEPDLSNVESMTAMFDQADPFNADISDWDVSNVEQMRSMFSETSFNQDISSWEVSQVEDFAGMFDGTPFNQDISNWDTSSAQYMQFMFRDTPFNQDIRGWDTSNVYNMERMFAGADSFNQPIGSWDTSNVDDMQWMFNDAVNFNQDISTWDTSDVNHMQRMFSGAESFNQDIGSWDTQNVQDMSGMFRGAESFNQDISSWDTSSVSDMDFMFYKAASFNQDISSWDTGRVGRFSDDDDQSNLHEGMRWMFRDATAFNQDLSEWCVQHIPDKPELFDEDAGFDGASSKHPDWGSSASC